MTCRSSRKQLSTYVDGELVAAKAERLEAHLTGCPQCTAELARMRATLGLLDGQPELEPSATFDAVFARKLRASESEAERTSGRRWGWRWPALATGLAAACAAVLVITLTRSTAPPRRTIQVPVIELAKNLDLLENYDVVDNLDGLEDFDVVASLDSLIEESKR